MALRGRQLPLALPQEKPAFRGLTVGVSTRIPRVDSDSRVSGTESLGYPKFERSEGVLTPTGQSCRRGAPEHWGASCHPPPTPPPTCCAAASVGAGAARKSAEGRRGHVGRGGAPLCSRPATPDTASRVCAGRGVGWPRTECARPAARGWRAAAGLGGLEPRCPRTGLGGRNYHPSW